MSERGERQVADAVIRAAELRRMRLLATLLLVMMTAIYVVASLARVDWPWVPYVKAFAEAGMVGACADWFAVVALFRHPLGLPIPHTAIVPRNKTRIGAALGRFISNNFLSPLVLKERLGDIDAAGFAARFIARPTRAERIARRATVALPQMLRALPRDDVNAFLARVVRHGVSAVPAAPLASKMLSVLWAQGETQALVEQAIALAEDALARNRDAIKEMVAQKTSRFIPKWIDAIIADKVMAGLARLLAEMRDPDHPWRIELRAGVERLIRDLATDPSLHARAEEIKAELIDNPIVIEQASRLWSDIEAQLDKNPVAYSHAVAGLIEQGLLALARWIETDERIREGLNQWLRSAILRILAPRRAEIGGFIAQVVERWDTTTLVNRLELQVGRDLQYIRINGTLVGGLVGLLIFTITQWL